MTETVTKATMTYDELVEKLPEHADDLSLAYDGGFGDCTDRSFSIQVRPMSKWKRCAEEYQDLFEGDEEHEGRIKEIMADIQGGGEQWPIYCDDGLLYEGHHRLVAFHRLGLPTVTVVKTVWEEE